MADGLPAVTVYTSTRKLDELIIGVEHLDERTTELRWTLDGRTRVEQFVGRTPQELRLCSHLDERVRKLKNIYGWEKVRRAS